MTNTLARQVLLAMVVGLFLFSSTNDVSAAPRRWKFNPLAWLKKRKTTSYNPGWETPVIEGRPPLSKSFHWLRFKEQPLRTETWVDQATSGFRRVFTLELSVARRWYEGKEVAVPDAVLAAARQLEGLSEVEIEPQLLWRKPSGTETGFNGGFTNLPPDGFIFLAALKHGPQLEYRHELMAFDSMGNPLPLYKLKRLVDPSSDPPDPSIWFLSSSPARQ